MKILNLKGKGKRKVKRPAPIVLRLILVGGLVALAVACGSAERVKIATLGNYYPFDFINEDGELDGLEIEIGNELCRRADLECEWVVNEWETIIPDLVAGKFDVILAGMSITAERDELIDFTEPYYPPTPSVYVAKAGEGEDALEGAIGVSRDTIYSDYLTEAGIAFVPLEHAADVVEALLDGQVDVVLVDHGYAARKIEQYEGRLEIVGPSISLDQGLGIGVRTGSELKGKLDGALASMKDDGTLDNLIIEWVGDEGSTF